MNADMALVIGLVLGVFSIPSMVSAYSDGRAPRWAAVSVVIAGGLVIYALRTHPGGYTFAEVPEAVIRVLARLLD